MKKKTQEKQKTTKKDTMGACIKNRAEPHVFLHRIISTLLRSRRTCTWNVFLFVCFFVGGFCVFFVIFNVYKKNQKNINNNNKKKQFAQDPMFLTFQLSWDLTMRTFKLQLCPGSHDFHTGGPSTLLGCRRVGKKIQFAHDVMFFLGVLALFQRQSCPTHCRPVWCRDCGSIKCMCSCGRKPRLRA